MKLLRDQDTVNIVIIQEYCKNYLSDRLVQIKEKLKEGIVVDDYIVKQRYHNTFVIALKENKDRLYSTDNIIAEVQYNSYNLLHGGEKDVDGRIIDIHPYYLRYGKYGEGDEKFLTRPEVLKHIDSLFYIEHRKIGSKSKSYPNGLFPACAEILSLLEERETIEGY